MADRETKTLQLPALTDTTPAGIRAWASAIRSAITMLSGQSARTANAALDQAVTFRDLIEAGFAVKAPPGHGVPVVPGDGQDFISTPPPAPTGFVVTRLAYNMRLEWTEPTYTYHDHTEVWRAASNNLTNAVKVTDVPKGISFYEDGYVEGQAWFYWIRFVSKAEVAGSFQSISGYNDNTVPDDVAGFTYEMEGFGVRLRWNKSEDADIDSYEVRVGTSVANSELIDETKGTSLLWKIQQTGTFRLFLRARDITGYFSGSAATLDVVVRPPGPASISASLNGPNLVLAWTVAPGSFALDYYEIRTGATWAGAVVIERAFSTGFRQLVDWGGTRTFWIAARDVAGNYATPVPIDIIIVVPGPVTGLRADVVDNNVLLYWKDPATVSLPITTFEISKGATYAGSVLVGEKSGQFTTVFEQAGGSFTYWIRAKDSAGSYGPVLPVTVTVNQPPDYILYSDQNLNLANATLTNALYEKGVIAMPFNTAQTWDQSYTTPGWSNDQDAISAGYPWYAQKVTLTSLATFTIDYGAVIPPTVVTVTPTIAIVVPTPTQTLTLSFKLNLGDAWTQLAVGPSGFITQPFRYVRIDFAVGSNDAAFLILSAMNIKLNTKQKQDGGQGVADASHATGTQFFLNVPFVDLFGPPIVQCQGTTALMPVVDFVDAPNPTSFKVYVFNNAGVRQTCPISWQARGI